jgi:hypothetical protein
MERQQALEQLNAFVGEWTVEVDLPGAPIDQPARSRFEWDLNRQFLVQRTTIPIPEAPDSFCVYSADPYLQHYYDSRGVIRVYEMTLEGGRWTLHRGKPDFTPLSFHQRYIGTFGDGTIEGAWETSQDGESWELDFHLNYSKVG